MIGKFLIVLLILSSVACDTGTSETLEERLVTYRKTNVEDNLGRISLRKNELQNFEFYDQNTNLTFVPSGYNYTEVNTYHWQNKTLQGHCTFNENVYSHDEANIMLNQLNTYGYNTVRIFLNPLTIADLNGNLLPQYITNLSNFIILAEHYNIGVIITTDLIPLTRHDVTLENEEDITWLNYQYIEQAEIDLEIQFWTDLIHQLIANKVPLDAILAYELRNEMAYTIKQAPFNLTVGNITAANGVTYDMSQLSEKIALSVDSFQFWSKAIRDAIQLIDHNALVTVGFYANFYAEELVSPLALSALKDSELDFIDLHMYQEWDEASNTYREPLDYAQYFDFNLKHEKAIIMGEFGLLPNYNDTRTIAEQAQSLFVWRSIMTDTLGIDGSILWAWNTVNGIAISVPEEKQFLQKLSPLALVD